MDKPSRAQQVIEDYGLTPAYWRNLRSFGAEVDCELHLPAIGAIHINGPTPAGTVLFIPDDPKEQKNYQGRL